MVVGGGGDDPVMKEIPLPMRESMCCLNLMKGFLDGGGLSSDIVVDSDHLVGVRGLGAESEL